MKPDLHERRKKTPFRFSIRALLLVTTLLAIGLGFFLHSVRDQQRAVASIEKHGGSVRYDFQRGVRAIGESSVPQWLLNLLSVDTFHRVTEVSINTRIVDNAYRQNTKYEPEVWDALTSLPHVRRFTLDYATIPSESFGKIRALKQLRSIMIANVMLDEAAIESLASLKELRSIAIYQGKLTDSSLKVFAQLPKLRVLLLEGDFSNEALATIPEASNLVELHLFGDNSTIDDDGIQHLTKLRKLKVVNLEGSQVTGAGLCQFAPMTSVKVLFLSETNVKWNDADSFKKELRPDVKFQGYLERAQANSSE